MRKMTTSGRTRQIQLHDSLLPEPSLSIKTHSGSTYREILIRRGGLAGVLPRLQGTWRDGELVRGAGRTAEAEQAIGRLAGSWRVIGEGDKINRDTYYWSVQSSKDCKHRDSQVRAAD